MKIVTFNLRRVSDADDENHFLNRSGLILERITAEKPDVIGFQEALPSSMAFFKKYLTDYTVIFNSRTADFMEEGLALAYRKDGIELHTLDRYWLSPTPQVPGSRYADQSQCPRICQAALLQELSSGKLFRVYNTHLDHIGPQARIEGIEQVLAGMAEDARQTAYPFFLLGDFNDFPDSEVIEFCREHPLHIVDLTAETGGTYHGYGKVAPKKIDYIFTDEKTAQNEHSAWLWTDYNNGIYISDHYPVCLTVAI